MDTFTVSPVTRDRVATLLSQLTQGGSKVVAGAVPDSWNIQGRKYLIKIEADAQYDEAAQALTVHVIQGPAGSVESELRKRLGLPS
jgi:hypothetical protein